MAARLEVLSPADGQLAMLREIEAKRSLPRPKASRRRDMRGDLQVQRRHLRAARHAKATSP